MDHIASAGQLVVGTQEHNKKAENPTTTGIPASNQADYRGNFGLTRLRTPPPLPSRMQQPQEHAAAGAGASVQCHMAPREAGSSPRKAQQQVGDC